jgi:ADP-heptose:LPS heptosyltransferase
MRLILDGGLGDQFAATAVVREFRRQFPDEMIRIEGVVHNPVWDNNPHLRNGKTENGFTVQLGLHTNEDVGSIPHAFAIQIAHVVKRDFQIQNDTPEIFLKQEERSEGAAILRDAGGLRPKAKILTFDTNAMWTSRRWPEKHFQEAIHGLRKLGWFVVQIGNTAADAYGNPPYRLDQVDLDLVNKTTIRQAASVIFHSDVFLGNDSGGFHMAAAVRCPQVALFGVKKWFSRAYWNTVPVFPYVRCLPECFDLCARTGSFGTHCLANVPPWRVVEAVEWAYLRFR